ncbi:MAG: OmpA family protein, partial [Saprospiraceae bacterium]
VLYFASDMPGGFGGMDLYMSEKEDGSWGPPLNLGPTINTEGNEVFPYYHQDKKLYFSSDGQIGLGGLDIYFMEDKEDGEWGAIENLGYPINSISDDFSIIFNEEGTCGHFSSDREGGAGRDDIYSFKKVASPVEILVFDKETKEPIEGAEVLDDCTGETLTTDKEGKVRIDMRMNECCTFTASMATYMNNDEEGCTKDIKTGTPVFVEITLEKELGFEIEGIVCDQSTGLPLEGALVTLTNDCDQETQTMTTDATGTYNFKLEKDCCYTVNGTKKSYFGSPIKDQCTRGLEEATTLQANLNLQPISVTDAPGEIQPIGDGPQTLNGEKDPCANVYKDVNRGIYIDGNTGEPYTGDCGGVTYEKGVPSNIANSVFPVSPTEYPTEEGETSIAYLLHIYYDFNQSYIRGEAEPELQKLYDMMVANPDYVIELSSHTDSRGSNSYNRTLSQRRAEAAVRWLIDKGINEDRLIPRGYGERKNVNGCANNIPCSEQEHQLNRRTEFRIVGCVGDEKVRTLSQPNPSPKLDSCQGCPF